MLSSGFSGGRPLPALMGDAIIAAIFVREGQTGTQWHLRAHYAVAAVEMFLFREHMHRAALALGIAPDAARQFGHNTLGIHPAGQHMAVVAIGGDPLVALAGRGL